MNTIVKTESERRKFISALEHKYEHGEEIKELIENWGYDYIVLLGEKSFVVVFDEDCNHEGCRLGTVRVSSEGQAAKGYGLAVQTEKIMEHCESKDLTLNMLAFDMGITGNNSSKIINAIAHDVPLSQWFKTIRPGLYYVMERLTPENRLLAYDPSRLWRDNDTTGGAIRMQVLSMDSDVEFVTHPEITLREMDGNQYMINTMTFVFAEYDRRSIVNKLDGGRKRAAKSGKHTSPAAYGYQTKKGEAYIVPEEANVICIIYNLIGNNHYKYRQVVDYLNRTGQRKRSGKEWTVQDICAIYKKNRELYTKGLVRSCGITFENPNLIIVQEESTMSA